MISEASVRDETIALNGLHFHYRDWGDPTTPPLVLLHAYTSYARSWETTARGLAGRFRVLALDQRGHGESDWATDYHEQRLLEDLEAFVEALGIATFVAVGFSTGGSAVCSYAARHPGHIQKLVLVECFGESDDPGVASHLRTLRSLPESFETPEEAAAVFRPLAPHAPADELLHWMRGGLVRRDDGRWCWRYDPIFRVPGPPGRLDARPEVFAARLAEVTCPTLLLVGAESFFVESAERMARVARNASLVRLAGADHWVPLDNPSGFLAAVSRFLDEE